MTYSGEYFCPSADGWYEFGVREERASGNIRLCLDDLQVLAVQPRKIDFKDDYYGEPAFDGDRRSFRFDFIPRMTRVRKLTKGRHLLDVYVYPGPWPYGDASTEMKMTNGTLRVGYTRLTGRNPRSETGFWLEGRDAMVFEKDEKVALRCQSGATEKRAYTLEFLKPSKRDAEGRPTALPDRRTFVVADGKPTFVDLKTDEEGAFDYQVRNAAGEIIEGPWQYVVVEVKSKKGKVKSAV